MPSEVACGSPWPPHSPATPTSGARCPASGNSRITSRLGSHAPSRTSGRRAPHEEAAAERRHRLEHHALVVLVADRILHVDVGDDVGRHSCSWAAAGTGSCRSAALRRDRRGAAAPRVERPQEALGEEPLDAPGSPSGTCRSVVMVTPRRRRSADGSTMNVVTSPLSGYVSTSTRPGSGSVTTPRATRIEPNTRMREPDLGAGADAALVHRQPVERPRRNDPAMAVVVVGDDAVDRRRRRRRSASTR